MVKDILPGDSNALAGDPMSALGDTLYFVARDGIHGYELWQSDGSKSGTVMVRDIYPGLDSADPRNLITLNGSLLFSAIDPAHGRELWSTGSAPVSDTDCNFFVLPAENGKLAVICL